MKTLRLIPTLFLSLLIAGAAVGLVGCGQPVGDFWGDKAKITEKYQSKFDKDKKQAQYTISFDSGRYVRYKFIMSENFGEVGDVINTTNRMWYALPENP